MNRTRHHNWLTYRMELSVIRVRGLIRPPAKILVDIGMRTGMTVLDFGCGPGGFSLAAARIVGPGGLVYAVDAQPLALESVRRTAARRGIGNIHPLPVERIPEVRRESVDIVLLYDVLHILSEPGAVQATLRSIHRVLKRDGILSVSDHHLQEARLLAKISGEGLFQPAGRCPSAFRFDRIATREAGV